MRPPALLRRLLGRPLPAEIAADARISALLRALPEPSRTRDPFVAVAGALAAEASRRRARHERPAPWRAAPWAAGAAAAAALLLFLPGAVPILPSAPQPAPLSALAEAAPSAVGPSLVAPSVSGAAADPAGEVAAARTRWAAAGITRYTFTLTRGCFCTAAARGPFTIVVGGAAAAGLPLGLPADVEGLFAVIEAHLGAARLEVVYNLDTGVPLTISVDPSAAAADEEFSLEVSGFAPLP